LANIPDKSGDYPFNVPKPAFKYKTLLIILRGFLFIPAIRNEYQTIIYFCLSNNRDNIMKYIVLHLLVQACPAGSGVLPLVPVNRSTVNQL